jgi:hypothetical protein
MLPYDATGDNIANKVSDEVHQCTNNPAIFPVQGAFYLKSLIVHGVLKGTETVRELSVIDDYGLGPLYASRSYASGKHAYSYFVLYRLSEYDSITITYQAVGGNVDSVLMAEIANHPATLLDREDPAFWLSLNGESCIRRTVDIDPEFKDMDVLQLLYNGLRRIEEQLRAPNAFLLETSHQYNLLVDQLNQDRVIYENLLANLQYQISTGQITINVSTNPAPPIIAKQKLELLEIVGGVITLSLEPLDGIDGICNFGYVAHLAEDGSTSYATVKPVLTNTKQFTIDTNSEEDWNGRFVTIQYQYLL